MDSSYRILEILNETPQISQRTLTEMMGISLGKVNFCLNELAQKSWIKIGRFKNSDNKTAYTYILPSRELQEKARLTLHFLKLKAEEYQFIKAQIAELYQELEKR